MLDGSLWRCPGSAIVPRNQNPFCMSFGNTGGNGTHPCFRNQLDAHSCIGIGIMKIKNQLLQIFY